MFVCSHCSVGATWYLATFQPWRSVCFRAVVDSVASPLTSATLAFTGCFHFLLTVISNDFLLVLQLGKSVHSCHRDLPCLCYLASIHITTFTSPCSSYVRSAMLLPLALHLLYGLALTATASRLVDPRFALARRQTQAALFCMLQRICT
jgi:hypothetical protein